MDILKCSAFLFLGHLIHLSEGNAYGTCGQLECPLPGDLNARYYPERNLPSPVPWAAYLIKDSDTNTTNPIPGIIISPTLIHFSQKHIKRRNLIRETYQAILGSMEIPLTSQNFQRIPISYFSFHLNYSQTNYPGFPPDDFALAHLAYPITGTSVQPVCFPSFEDKENALNTPGNHSMYIAGFQKFGYYKFVSYGLEIRSEQECTSLFSQLETKHEILGNRVCGNKVIADDVGNRVDRDIGSFYLKNGSFYFAGGLSKFYSVKKYSAETSPHLLWSHSKEVHLWIQNSISCGPNSFSCSSSNDCFQSHKLCDGAPDCGDSSDEHVLTCGYYPVCQANEFQCKTNGFCIPQSKLNDGHEDCEDGEDEAEKSGNSSFLIVGIAASIVAFSFIVTAVVCCCSTLKKNTRGLNESEIKEFFEGEVYTYVQTSPQVHLSSECSYMSVMGSQYTYRTAINSLVLQNPWKDEFEVPRESLQIGKEIGRGQYGIVYKGHIRPNSYGSTAHGTSEVAVKTPHPKLSVQEFKNLLREIKITAHVGSHPAIVSFIGACTKNIRKQRVYLIVELCAVGNLLCFLQKQDKQRTRTAISFRNPKKECNPGNEFTMNDLNKWAYQIASGMVYLGNRKVIHGDLAARNILVDEHLNAKISDFGLSREINTTDVYVKTTQQRMPLKWMAPESILRRTFSYKSDVWAYGVTLWEIFSLGQTPYENILCNSDFVARLRNGFRLPAPPYASQDTCSIIVSTWNEDPASRPTFESLEEQFSSIIRNTF